MKLHHGFSLIEVLLSLLLMSGISMALLKQQWQISQLLNQILTRVHRLVELDNQVEQGA